MPATRSSAGYARRRDNRYRMQSMGGPESFSARYRVRFLTLKRHWAGAGMSVTSGIEWLPVPARSTGVVQRRPSLWREAQLNAISGLFKVADGVYQVRGFSPSNMNIVEGSTASSSILPKHR